MDLFAAPSRLSRPTHAIIPSAPVEEKPPAVPSAEANAWYEEMDADYFRHTGVHLWEIDEKITGRKRTEQDNAEDYERYCRWMARRAGPKQSAPVLYQGMLVRRKAHDKGIYRVTGWRGVPSLDGVAVEKINADLTARTLLAIPPSVILFCCANLKGEPQFIYLFRAEDVEATTGENIH
jgi:hypothetical protein